MAAFTQDQYDALKAAIAEGVLIVEYADKKVQYRTLDDMIRILALMGEELGIGPEGTMQRTYAVYNNGL